MKLLLLLLLRQAWVCQDLWWVGWWSVRYFEIDRGVGQPNFSSFAALKFQDSTSNNIAIAIANGI